MTGKNIFNGLHFPKMIQGGGKKPRILPEYDNRLDITPEDVTPETAEEISRFVKIAAQSARDAAQIGLDTLANVESAEKRIKKSNAQLQEAITQMGEVAESYFADNDTNRAIANVFYFNLSRRAGITPNVFTVEGVERLCDLMGEEETKKLFKEQEAAANGD